LTAADIVTAPEREPEPVTAARTTITPEGA
jgi:hypothetical protein